MEAHGEKQPASARDLKAGQSTLASSLPDWTQFDPVAGAQVAAHATMDAASQAATQAAAAAASAAKAGTHAAESAVNSAANTAGHGVQSLKAPRERYVAPADLPTPRSARSARSAG